MNKSLLNDDDILFKVNEMFSYYVKGNYSDYTKVFDPDLVNVLVELAIEQLLKSPLKVNLKFSSKNTLFFIGDIHGDIITFLKVLDLLRDLNQFFIFVGDYVDRGKNGVEVMLGVTLLTILYPDNFIFLRGNHEIKSMNKSKYNGTFKDECLLKYNSSVFNSFTNLYNYLPLACKVNDLFYICHGGIPYHLDDYLLEINFNKPCNVEENKGLLDMIWSDPFPDNDDYLNYGHGESCRKIGHYFGHSAVENFCKLENVKMIIRGHQFVKDKCDLTIDNKVLTVFSSADYLGLGNKSSIVKVTPDEKNNAIFNIIVF